MSSIIIIIAFIVLALSTVPFFEWYIKRSRYVNLINAIPGPKAYPLIGATYLAIGLARENMFGLYKDMHAKYPRILSTWIGPVANIEIKKAEHVEKILSSSRHHLEKSFTYKFFRPWLGDGLILTTGDRWHSHRKILTPTFHFTILESFCGIFSENANILVEELAQFCDTGVPVDVHPYVTKTTLDIISSAAMGVQINDKDQSGRDYTAAIYEMTELIVRRLLRPWLHPGLFFRWSADGKKFVKSLNVLQKYTKNVIKQRRSQRTPVLHDSEVTWKPKKRLAFLDFLLETNEQGRDYLNDDDICAEVDTFMFAGHDTTTVAIGWNLFLLGQHPEIQEEAFHELEGIFQGSERSATIHDLNEMKCLDRIIKESLRLYPSVPSIARILSEDVYLDEYTLPKGCNVAIEIYMLHRDERYFPDPERFDPDRFLPENTVNRHPYAYLPFSGGARNCIGQRFAVYELKSILSSIIRNFRFKSVNTCDNVKIIREILLTPLDGVPLVLQRRVK